MSRRGSRPSSAATRDLWRVRAGQWVLFALAVGFHRLTRPLGVWTLAGLIAPLGGRLAQVVPSWRRRVADNLDLVRPDGDHARRETLIRSTGAAFTRLMVEYAHLDRFLDRLEIAVEGLEHVTGPIKEGRGVVLVSAHFGNWEAIRAATRRVGVDCGIFYRAFNNRYLDRHAQSLIAQVGQPVLQKGAKGLRGLIAHVSRGGAVLILVDQRSTGAPLIPFLDHPAQTTTSVAQIAQRTGAALVPAVAFRNTGQRRFEVRFEPEITPCDPNAAMAEVNAAIGRWILSDPPQWFWFQRRWRRVARWSAGSHDGSTRVRPG
ncbi:MAG: lysophospholipid acyltransferase family protein [Pikeienuella sp.]